MIALLFSVAVFFVILAFYFYAPSTKKNDKDEHGDGL